MSGDSMGVAITPAIEKRLRAWEDSGIVSRREMQRRTGISTRRLAQLLGKRERNAAPIRPMMNIYCYKRAFRMAAKVARELGYRLTAGSNYGGGSVGLMVEAIGNGELAVVPMVEYRMLRGFAASESMLESITGRRYTPEERSQYIVEYEDLEWRTEIDELVMHGLPPQ